MMGYYALPENRLILLIEQARTSLLSGLGIDTTIRQLAGNFSEFGFLGRVLKKRGEGNEISAALSEEAGLESYADYKALLEALNSGNFAPQKLDELRTAIIKRRKENFEQVSSSLMKKIGLLALFFLLPAAVYFLSGLTQIFQEANLGEFSIGQGAKMTIIAVCAVVFLFLLFSRRVENG